MARLCSPIQFDIQNRAKALAVTNMKPNEKQIQLENLYYHKHLSM